MARMSSGNTTVPSARHPRNPVLCEPPEEEPDVPAFVIVHAVWEPGRIGEVALLALSGITYVLGRGHKDMFQVVFGQQRPGSWGPTGSLNGVALPREQCRITVDENGVDI